MSMSGETQSVRVLASGGAAEVGESLLLSGGSGHSSSLSPNSGGRARTLLPRTRNLVPPPHRRVRSLAQRLVLPVPVWSEPSAAIFGLKSFSP